MKKIFWILIGCLLPQLVLAQAPILCNVKNNAGLRTVIRAAVDFCAFFIIGTEHVQRDRSSQLAFSVFLSDFNVGSIELPVAVLFDQAEQISDDLLLPREQVEGLS